MVRRQLGLALLALSLSRTNALTFTLAPAVDGPSERCISESVPQRSLVAGDWTISPVSAPVEAGSGSSSRSSSASGSSAHVRIFGPDGKTEFTNDHLRGHFAVTAQAVGVHRICVESNASEARTVTINIKMALQVESHDTVAKKEHVEAIEGELDRMRKMAVHVYEEMLFMRRRADQQHATNASTRGRLLWVEVVMMFSVLLMGLWQIRYLRNCAPAASLPMASLPPSVARSSTCVLPAADAWVASDAWSTLLVRPTADFKVKKLI